MKKTNKYPNTNIIMLITIAALIIGLAVLAKASDVAVMRTAKLSKLLGINKITAGFIFLAVSTSLPELTIAIFSSLRGEGLLSVGNLIGANIINMTLIIGLVAVFCAFSLKKKDSMLMEQAVVFSSIIAFFAIFLKKIDFIFGIFCIIIFYVFSKIMVKEGLKTDEKLNHELRTPAVLKSIFFVLLAVAFIIISAKFVTDSAVEISSAFGLKESLIGATLLALGTTLPELSVGIAAIRRKDIKLAIGNSVGSVAANITLILGIAAIINPISLGTAEISLMWFLIASGLAFLFISSSGKFDRKRGIALISAFAIYLIYVMVIA